MNYRVEWLQTALDELMTIWADADSEVRTELNSSVRYLDRELERNPQGFGESRDPDEWVCFADSLGALIEIDEPGQIVWVLAVWRVR